MKRILYNSKLKKILSSLLLVMLIFQIMMPSFVYADDIVTVENDAGKEYANLRKWKKEIINERGNKEEDYIEVVEKTIVEQFKSTSLYDTSVWPALMFEDEKREKMLQAFVRNCSDNVTVFNGTWTEAESNSKKTFTFDNVGWNQDTEYLAEQFICKTYSQLLSIIENKMEEEEAKEWLDGKILPLIQERYYPNDTVEATSEELAKSDLEDKRETYWIYTIEPLNKDADDALDKYEFFAIDIPGTDPADIRKNNALNPEEDGDADLGGILLSPVFYLINFIADAIISNLGRIMYPESGSSVHGIDILKQTPVDTDYTQTSQIELYLSSVLGDIQYPNIKYTPEEIFSGKIELLSIDFISGTNSEGEPIKGDWSKIREVISAWYKALRMIAIIGLLSVLIYTGIKIIISANAKDKAKYKEWIINWFIAVAILFSMHYIMSFIISVVGELNALLGQACQGIKVTHKGGWPFKDFTTNLMGVVRFMIQSEDFTTKVAYEVMYIALIVYTIKFTVIYLKRVLNMAFLTLIAPIVALTYPIDKMNDGSAQGFNMWLKEYIFNALLQPMHYIMYYILVGSAVSIAASNPIYGIVVLMFMTEAEKLLKKIFGFDKAGGGTVGGMANAFAAGAVASQIGKLAKDFGKGSSKRLNGGQGDSGAQELPPTIKDTNNVEDNFAGIEGEADNSGGGNSEGGNSEGRNSGDSGNNSSENQTAQQQMLDNYDDNYNTDEWDAAERDAMARDAYANEPGMTYSDDEYRQILIDSGYEGEELERMMGNDADEQKPTAGPSAADAYQENEDPIAAAEKEALEEKLADGQLSEDELTNEQRALLGMEAKKEQSAPNPQPTPDSKTSIREMAQKITASRQFKGAKAVGKKLIKPVWDFDKSKKYNRKRLVRNLGKAAVGFSVGTAAAAVQAGISITDGKYSAYEGVAAFGAGWVGGNKVAGGMVNAAKGVKSTFEQGYHSEDNEHQKKLWEEKQRERYHEDWSDRDDVNKIFKEKFGEKDFKKMKQQAKMYTDRGYNDPKEVAKLMKATNKLGWDDKTTIAAMNFQKDLKDQQAYGALFDSDKKDKYIQSIIDNKGLSGNEANTLRKQYEQAFKAVLKLNDAMS